MANIARINLTVSILNTNEIPFVSFEYYIIPYPPTEEKIAFLFPLICIDLNDQSQMTLYK